MLLLYSIPSKYSHPRNLCFRNRIFRGDIVYVGSLLNVCTSRFMVLLEMSKKFVL